MAVTVAADMFMQSVEVRLGAKMCFNRRVNILNQQLFHERITNINTFFLDHNLNSANGGSHHR